MYVRIGREGRAAERRQVWDHFVWRLTCHLLLFFGQGVPLARTRECGLSGTVTDARANKPIAAAVVRIDDVVVASSGLDGTYRATAVRAGRCRIAVHVSGFVPIVRKIRLEPGMVNTVDFNLYPTDKMITGDCDTCNPAPLLIGQVLDQATGAPISQARVTIQEADADALSDGQGKYSVVLPESGDYSLAVSREGYHDTAGIVVTCRAGTATNASFLLQPLVEPQESTGTVAGIVMDESSGNPVPGAEVQTTDMTWSAPTDSRGQFSARLPPGRHVLVATHKGFAPTVLPFVDVPRGERVSVSFMLKPLSTTDYSVSSGCITGRVLHEGRPQDVTVIVVETGFSDTCDSLGRFIFSDLSEGNVTLAAMMGGDTVATSSVEISRGEALFVSLHTDTAANKSDEKLVPGTVAGLVVDSRTQHPVSGAMVSIAKERLQATTGLDGRYLLGPLQEGIHVLSVSHDDYGLVSDTAVLADGKGQRVDILLSSTDITQLDRITVRDVLVRRTNASLLRERQTAFDVSDKIAAEDMSKSGASSAADAVRYVPGITLENDRYPIIRGLSDRYVGAQMNGMRLPSPDPDRNIIALDLFPASLIDYLSVQKTYSPDKWGDFCAGTVVINLKAHPETLESTAKAGIGFNDATTFRDDFLAEEGGQTDWLGFDDGARALPEELGGSDVWAPTYYEPLIASYVSEDSALRVVERLDHVAKAFDDAPMAGTERSAPLNQSYGVSVGGRAPLNGRPLGIVGGISYSLKRQTYRGARSAVWDQSDGTATVLTCDRSFAVQKSKEEVLWGALAGLAFRPAEEHAIEASYLYSRNAEDVAAQHTSVTHLQLNDPNAHLIHNEIMYTERGLHFLHVGGKHEFRILLRPFIEWSAAYANGVQNEPDYRVSTMTMQVFETDSGTDTSYTIERSLGVTPSHRFRYTEETSGELRLDLTIPFRQWTDTVGFVKAGAAWRGKHREFWQRRFWLYETATRAVTLNELNGDINEFVASDNMGIMDTDTAAVSGWLRIGDTSYRLGNIYLWDPESDSAASHTAVLNPDLSLKNLAAYLMLQLPLFRFLEVEGGLRYEPVRMSVRGVREQDSLASGGFTKEFWPFSIALRSSIREDMSVRAAVSRTFALPVFRELAPQQTYDVAHGDMYVGNPGLKPSTVTGTDIRWDWYVAPSEIISLGAFYKHVDGPVIIGAYGGGTSNDEKTWYNSKQGKLYGVEFELRKDLGFVHRALTGLTLGGNVTFVHSEARVDTVKELFLQNVSEPELDPPWIYASPYVVNAFLTYDNDEVGTSAGAFINVFGPRRVFQTGDFTPDVYEFARPNLVLTVSQRLFSKVSVKLSAKNLLNPRHTSGQEYKGVEYERSGYRKGRSYSVSLQVKL